jgi:hypothetical protein
MRKLSVLFGLVLVACGGGSTATLISQASPTVNIGATATRRVEVTQAAQAQAIIAAASAALVTPRPPSATSTPVPTNTPVSTRTPVPTATPAASIDHIKMVANTTATVKAGASSQKLTFIKFTDNAKSANQVNQPKANQKFVTIEVMMENTSAKEILAGSWRLQATDGYEYETTNDAGLGESLALTQLTPGGKKQGVHAFMVPADASVKWIRYRLTDGLSQGDIYFDAA